MEFFLKNVVGLTKFQRNDFSPPQTQDQVSAHGHISVLMGIVTQPRNNSYIFKSSLS